MNDIESRLADAMAARAAEVEPEDEHDALERITQRVNVSRRRGLTVLGIAAAVAVAVGAVALLRRDDNSTHRVNASDGSTTTTAPTSSTTPASVIPQPTTDSIWPFAASNDKFDSAEAAAKSFAVDYLGMTVARVGTTSGNNVEIFPNDRASTRTVVRVENQGARGWVVIGSSADDATVDTPAPHSALTSPLTVSGRSRAFEAQIALELRAYGSMVAVAKGVAMGGSSEIQPFSTTLTPPSPDEPLVLLVYEPDASGQGQMSYATVVPLEAAGGREPAQFFGTTTSGRRVVVDLASGEIKNDDSTAVATSSQPPQLPSSVNGTLPALRGRFGTIAFWDGTNISSYNPNTGAVVKLVTPVTAPASLDADDSGRYLLWVDADDDVWKWSGGDAVKIGTGFISAAW
jgi:hypothetical protein